MELNIHMMDETGSTLITETTFLGIGESTEYSESQHEVLRTAVGALFVALDTRRVLLAMRAEHKTYAMCWSIFGGMMEQDEDAKEALCRELSEEMGYVPEINKLMPFDVYYSSDKHFKYVSFIGVVDHEFVPKLNYENIGYCWVNLGTWPKPLHTGTRSSFGNSKAIKKIEMILDEVSKK